MASKTSFMLDGVSEYIAQHSQPEHPLLESLRNATAQLPQAVMQISAQQGQLMMMLARLMNAKRYLEVGTFTGYSSLAMALAMPDDAQLCCCDVSEDWTRVAQTYWQKAGVDARVQLHLADARQTLEQLTKDADVAPFDIAFIDADKANYQHYFDLCLALVREGGLVMIDNTLWSGQVMDSAADDADTRALREFNTYLLGVPNISLSFLPIADGLTLVHKLPVVV